MRQIHTNRPVLSASVLALALATGISGVASAKAVNVNANLTDITGSVTSGTNSTGTGNVSALLDFSVAPGSFGSDANDLAGSSSAVDFNTSITGDIATGTIFGTFNGSKLNASNSFSSGSGLADFLLGNSTVNFDSATLTAGPVNGADVADPTGAVKNATFNGDATLANLIGGTLDISGDNDTLAGLNLDGSFNNGSATIAASGDVASSGGGGTPPDMGGGTPPDMGGGTPPDMGGGTPPDMGGGTPPDMGGGTPPDMGGGTPPDMGGGSAEVPTPSGWAMLLFTGIGAAGMGFARRRKSKRDRDTDLGAA